MKNAALNSERSDKSRISIQDVSKSYEEVKEIEKKYYLERLSSHHKLIVEIVKENPGIHSKDLYNDYARQAKRRKLGIAQKSKRTISNYIKELVELGYLKVERAKVRGNVRPFRKEFLEKELPKFDIDYWHLRNV